LAPRNRRTPTAPGASRLITAGQVIGTLQVTHRREGSHGGPADETVRSGIGGTAYQIDVSDRGRILASMVQRCQSRRGKTVPTAWRIADPNQSPGGKPSESAPLRADDLTAHALPSRKCALTLFVGFAQGHASSESFRRLPALLRPGW